MPYCSLRKIHGRTQKRRCILLFFRACWIRNKSIIIDSKWRLCLSRDTKLLLRDVRPPTGVIMSAMGGQMHPNQLGRPLYTQKPFPKVVCDSKLVAEFRRFACEIPRQHEKVRLSVTPSRRMSANARRFPEKMIENGKFSSEKTESSHGRRTVGDKRTTVARLWCDHSDAFRPSL